jgi:hypothetical protein
VAVGSPARDERFLTSGPPGRFPALSASASVNWPEAIPTDAHRA